MVALIPQDDEAEKAKERIIEINSRLYDRAAAYTNLILIGGYAGAFTIWNLTKSQLTPRITITIAFLLGASIAVLIAFEVYKMIKNSIYFWEFQSKLGNAKTPREFIDKYDAFTKETSKQNFSFFKLWAASVIFCIVTALLAVAILFCEFFVLLLPPWSS